MDLTKKETRGRKKGSVARKPRYVISYCNLKSDNPVWITFECCSQSEIALKLQNDYQFKISRDVFQNILLNRFHKKEIPFLKITSL